MKINHDVLKATLIVLSTWFGLLAVNVAWGDGMSSGAQQLDLTQHWVGYCALLVFVVAYLLVIFEEQLHLRKSKPVLCAAGIIWILIAWVYRDNTSLLPEEAIRHNFLEYAELFFFLLVAMTYINAMLERGVFDALRTWLIKKQLSYRMVFWSTGALAFVMSPIADNLTTALILCAVVLAVGKGQKQFIAVACVNIVVSANAGGSFSPFGDITTLMVWQKGIIEFREFFALFLPSVVNCVIPALCMQFAVPEGRPEMQGHEAGVMKIGGGSSLACSF